jgi:hypothetical protein
MTSLVLEDFNTRVLNIKCECCTLFIQRLATFSSSFSSSSSSSFFLSHLSLINHGQLLKFTAIVAILLPWSIAEIYSHSCYPPTLVNC